MGHGGGRRCHLTCGLVDVSLIVPSLGSGLQKCPWNVVLNPAMKMVHCSWNHCSWVGGDLKNHPVPPLPWQGHLPLSQAAPAPVSNLELNIAGIQGQPQLLWAAFFFCLIDFFFY